MDKRLGRKHLQIIRQYVKHNFKEYYTFALRKFRGFYEKQYSFEQSHFLTEKEIEIYKNKNILSRIKEFNRTGNVKRNYTPRPKKNKVKFGYEYYKIKIIFD